MLNDLYRSIIFLVNELLIIINNNTTLDNVSDAVIMTKRIHLLYLTNVNSDNG